MLRFGIAPRNFTEVPTILNNLTVVGVVKEIDEGTGLYAPVPLTFPAKTKLILAIFLLEKTNIFTSLF
jgi:hypothetical protein